MRNFTPGHTAYIDAIVSRKRRSYRITAVLLLVVSIFISFWLPYNPNLIELSLTVELTGVIISVGVLLLLSIYLFIQSASLKALPEIQHLNGIYSVSYRRRRRMHKIDGKRVLLPVIWIDYFQGKESYAVKGTLITGVFGKEDFIVLEVADMPANLANRKLADDYNEGHALLLKVLFYQCTIFAVVAAPFVGIYYIVSSPELFQKAAEALVSLGKPLVVLFGILLLLLQLGLILLIRKIYNYFSERDTQVVLILSWKAWLNAYRAFMEEEMIPFLKNDRRNPEAFTKYRVIMNKNKRFKLEYKRYKRQLYGREKEDFIRAFKALHKTVRKG